MSLSNKLLENLMEQKSQQPDTQSLFYTAQLPVHFLLAQMKWCLDNDMVGADYLKLKNALVALYGEYEINLLIRRYKQIYRNNIKDTEEV